MDNLDLEELKKLLAAYRKTKSPDEEASFGMQIADEVPALLQRLEAAEAERDTATDAEAGHWIGIIRNLDREKLCDVFDGLGVEENLRQWLADRDARMKREGAAEWLENAAREGGYYERSSEGMLEEAKQLREEK